MMIVVHNDAMVVITIASIEELIEAIPIKAEFIQNCLPTDFLCAPQNNRSVSENAKVAQRVCTVWILSIE